MIARDHVNKFTTMIDGVNVEREPAVKEASVIEVELRRVVQSTCDELTAQQNSCLGTYTGIARRS